MLSRNFQEMLNRSSELVEKAKDFNQEKLLENLGANRLNSFYFRFDEHLREAKVYLYPKVELKALDGHHRLDLSNNQNPFEVEDGQMVVKDRLLIIETKKGAKLQNRQDLDLDSRKIKAVAIRLRAKKNNLINLGWSTSGSIDWNDWKFFVNIHIVNDNKFHTYLVEVDDRFRGWLGGERVKKIGLCFQDSDEIELEYIQPVTKLEKYKANHYGIGYEQIKNERRRVIFMHTPLKLGYKVKIPKKDTFLSFGMGILKIGITQEIFFLKPFRITLAGSRMSLICKDGKGEILRLSLRLMLNLLM
jgi:hypothetical protein